MFGSTHSTHCSTEPLYIATGDSDYEYNLTYQATSELVWNQFSTALELTYTASLGGLSETGNSRSIMMHDYQSSIIASDGTNINNSLINLGEPWFDDC